MATPDPTPPDRRLQTDGEAHQGGDEHHRGEEHQDVASPSDQQHPGEASPSQYTPAAPSPLSNGRSWTSKIHEFFTAKGRPALNTNGSLGNVFTSVPPCICTLRSGSHLQFIKPHPIENAMRRVVVTGLGAITPLGAGIKTTWQRLLKSSSGLVSTTSRGPAFQGLPSTVAGLVPLGRREDGAWQAKDWLAAKSERQMALFAQYAVAAADEALEDAGWHPTLQDDLEATGVTIGSGIGNLDEAYNTSVAFHEGGYRKVSPLFVPKLLINLAAGHVSIRHGFQGPNHAATTACTTGLHAIGDASRLIAFGDANVMVAGGAESCIHPLAIAGFARARSLAIDWNDNPTAASRPFDSRRAGFVIGEGAGVVVLEELEHAKARKANIYAEVRGYGLSSDAYHMTAPQENGQGAFLAMKQALKHAGLKPEAVDYVNAHATSTVLGDAAENRAIKRLLLGPEGRANPSDLNVSSTKGAVGHLLGAAGAVEAIFTMLAVHHDILPPTLNLGQPGNPADEFDCNYVPNTAQKHTVNAALTNSFGFGGTNASLCLAKYP